MVLQFPHGVDKEFFENFKCRSHCEVFSFIAFIPNVFTPNGDGINEGFGPKGIEFNREYKFTIYNRWGEIVFYTEDPNETWDGQYQNKPCPIGVYIYRIDLRDIYGRTHNLDGSFLMKY